MNEEQIIERVNTKLKDFGRLIFLTITGSKLYGTSTPESDNDYVGVFILNKKYILGFNTVREVDCSIKDKDKSGKNTKDAIDIKVYELKHFLKLSMNNNPNIIELLFVKEPIFNTLEFKIFQDNYKLFINQRAYHTFKGYAIQQFKKGIMKVENYNLINKVLEILNKYDDDLVLGVVVEKESLLKKCDKGKIIELSGLSIHKNKFLKQVKEMLNNRISNVSHRLEMWKKFNYDTKFFAHLFRLLEEGKELIETGKLEFPVSNKEFLMDVRKGKFDLNTIQQIAEDKFNEFNNIDNKLPKKPNINKIEQLLINIFRNEIK